MGRIGLRRSNLHPTFCAPPTTSTCKLQNSIISSLPLWRRPSNISRSIWPRTKSNDQPGHRFPSSLTDEAPDRPVGPSYPPCQGQCRRPASPTRLALRRPLRVRCLAAQTHRRTAVSSARPRLGGLAQNLSVPCPMRLAVERICSALGWSCRIAKSGPSGLYDPLRLLAFPQRGTLRVSPASGVSVLLAQYSQHLRSVGIFDSYPTFLETGPYCKSRLGTVINTPS